MKVKQLLTCLLTLLGSIAAYAYDFELNGVYYNITDTDAKTVEVTYVENGEGNADFYYGSIVIPKRVSKEGVTYNVTSIGDYAFINCSSLSSVTIPEGVTSIGFSAFQGCTGLTNVTIPNSMTSIGNFAFDGCSGLTSVSIPNSVTSIGNYAFSDCSGLTSVTIGNSVTSIGEYVFYSCSSLTSVTIGNSVTSISERAFSGCSGLTSVTIGNSVTSIGTHAFDGCSGLTSVSIPNSVTSIGNYAFSGCSGLTKAEFASIESLCSIDFSTFTSNPLYYAHHLYINGEEITDLVIPETVTSIGEYVFYSCSSLTSVTIPNSVTSIGNYAFDGCSGLTKAEFASIGSLCSIDFSNYASNPLCYAHHLYINGEEITDLVIPETVTSIGKHAFRDCSGLTSVTIPNSVTSIGNHAFYGCYGLTKAEFASIGSLCSIIFNGSNPLYYAHHLYINGEEITDLAIPETVTSIGNFAFYGCSSLTSVSIPNSVTSIGNYAFSDCSSLTSVTIGNSVTSIGEYVFYSCSSLTSVTIGNSVTSIGYSVFEGCSSLTSVTIPNSVTSIDSGAFSGCSGLTSVTIPNSVTSIGNFAFEGCTGLTTVMCPRITPPNAGSNFLNGVTADIVVPEESIEDYKTATNWSNYANQMVPGTTIKYNAVWKGEVAATATQFARIGGATPTQPAELSHDFVTLKLDGTWPETVGSKQQINYNIDWSGPFQFSTSDDDATWYNLRIAEDSHNAYIYANGSEPYYPKRNPELRDLATKEYQWALGGNPYHAVLYNRSAGFGKSMKPTNGYINRSTVALRDGDYTWELDSLYDGFMLYNKAPESPVLLSGFGVGGWDTNVLYNNIRVTDTDGNVIYEAGEIKVPSSCQGIYQYLDGMPANCTIEIDAVKESGAEGFIIAFASANSSNFTWLNLGGWSNANHAIEESVNGDRQVISEKLTGSIETGRTYHMKIVRTENHADCYLDGELLYSTPIAETSYFYTANASEQPFGYLNWFARSEMALWATDASNHNDAGQLMIPKLAPKLDVLYTNGDKTSIMVGGRQTLSLNLMNEDQIVMTDFYLRMPDGIRIMSDEYGPLITLNSNRSNKHTLEVKEVEDGLYHVVCYSSKNNALKGNDGELYSVELICDRSVAIGNYEAQIVNMIMSDENKNSITQEDYTISIDVPMQLGDVNGDGSINGLDIVEIVDHILERPSETFYFDAANMYYDSRVNGQDLVELVKYVVNQSTPTGVAAKAASFISEPVHESGLLLSENGDGGMALGVNVADDFILLQCEITMSEGMTLNDIVTDKGHVAAWQTTGENRYTVVVYSARNAVFGSNEALLTFCCRGAGTMNVENAMLVDTDKTARWFDAISQDYTTGIQTINGAEIAGEQSGVYDIQGRKIENGKIEKGFYIVNGKKVMKK